ncbi:MAG: S1C family serine protease [Methyloligellaceae bacterium]
MRKIVEKYLLIAALLSITLWASLGLIQVLLYSGDSPRAITPRGKLANFEQTSISLFKNTAPSVAYIYPVTGGRNPFGRTVRTSGTGSGFVWDKAGHIITNYHVVKGASQVYVRLNVSDATIARVIGISPDHDLAVLRVSVPPGKLAPIPIGSSSDLQIGQSVFAIGNPFGLKQTLTTGIVSALNRGLPTSSAREISGVIQTDAAINPGNSGGPLLDSAGRLIGVNTAIATKSGTYSGIGFAIPVDTVNRIVPQLIRNGKAERPGIGIQAFPQEIAARLGVQGVVIASVLPNGPADKAGLIGVDRSSSRIGDIIIAMDNKPVRDLGELTRALEKSGIGRTVILTIIRNNTRKNLKVTIADIS